MDQATTTTIEPRTEEAIALVDAGLAPADNRKCIAVIEAVERCRRRLEAARAEHGDAACYADLPRNPAQRRADAFWRMSQDVAGARGSTAADLVHNVVWSSETFEAILASLATGESPRLNLRTHHCSTVDGVPLEPTEAASTVFVAKVRRTARPDGTEID
jgi:hypothetical protein